MDKRGALVSKRKTAFLEQFARAGTIAGACRLVGISRECVTSWRNNDPAFEQAFMDTELDITNTLESRAMSQAMNGDTPLIMFLLKARRPDMYREKQTISLDTKNMASFTLTMGDKVAK